MPCHVMEGLLSSPGLRCDLALEEKGGEQAMLPLLARMLKMAGWSAVRTRRICDQQHPSGEGCASARLPAFTFPTVLQLAALAQQWLLPHHLPSCCLTPSVLQEPSPGREVGRTGAHLETGELGLHVLLSQVQPGLPEEDAQGPQPKEGGGTSQGVDPEGHTLC